MDHGRCRSILIWTKIVAFIVLITYFGNLCSGKTELGLHYFIPFFFSIVSLPFACSERVWLRENDKWFMELVGTYLVLSCVAYFIFCYVMI